MKRLFVLAACLVGVSLSACSGCNERGQPVVSLRNPFLIDREAETVSTGRARVRYVREVEEPSAARFMRVDPCAPQTQRTFVDPCLPNGTDARTPAVR